MVFSLMGVFPMVPRPSRKAILPIALGILAMVTAVYAVVSRDVAEPDVTIVMERSETAVEIFFKASAKNYVGLFGTPFDELTNIDGTVDYRVIQEYGTATAADRLLDRVRSTAGDQLIDFESMSMMVHPPRLDLPLNSPFDGMLAISVCAYAPPEEPVHLEELDAYAGFIAFHDNLDRLISVRFPSTGRPPLKASIVHYVEGRPVGTSEAVLADGGTLTFEPVSVSRMAALSVDAPDILKSVIDIVF